MDRKVATFVFVFVNSLIFAIAFENATDVVVKKVGGQERSLVSPGKEESKNVKMDEAFSSEQKWISQLFLDAERNFGMDSRASEQCKRDYDMYKLNLRNQSVWAVRMMESSQWPATGIFSGMVDHLGNYDECLLASSRRFKGQYCLAEAEYKSKSMAKETSVIMDKADEESSAWNAIEMFLANPVRVDRHKLRWAICIPSSCSNTDLELSLTNTLSPLFKKQNLSIAFKVKPHYCNVRTENEDTQYPLGYYYVSALYGVIFSLVIASTTYDLATEKKIKGKRDRWSVEAFKCFSAVKNYKALVRYSPNKDYVLIHFAKILNIMLVIYGHRFIFFIGYPKFNSEGVESYYRASSIELIHTNVVDVFFAISGFLTFNFGVLPMLKGGYVYLFFSVVFRWIRMVPVFGILMLFIIYILPYTSEGPFWNDRVLGEVAKCKASWWANLLIINNIVKTDQQCLVVSWYISADIQLAILGSILLFITTRNKKLGMGITVLCLIGFAAVTFTVAYINKFYGVLRLYMSLLEEPRRSYEFTNFYVATYTRAGPYLLGFIAAMIAATLKDRNYKFSGKQQFFISVMSILIGEGSQYYGCLFYAFGREYNRIESALYASINRSLFVLPYVTMICLYFVSGLSWFQKLLERRIFVPMGRLTYSVFLVNTVIQLIHASSQKTIMPSSTRLNLYWWAMGDIVMSYFFGFFLYMFCEAPITNMSKLIQIMLFRLFSKNKSKESIDKTDSATTDDNDKSSPCNSKSSSPELANGKPFQNGYHNQSYENNEVIPAVSESSKI